MHSKPHRTNSDFQLWHFFAGSCHTADGAWAVMYSEKIALEGKLRHTEAQRLTRESKIAAAEEILEDPTSKRSQKLKAQAEIVEQEADIETWTLNVEAARMELNTINEIMAKIEPLRKYAHLPMLEANEACQEEEWMRELQYRAENFILTQGSIPHDHFARMREHPKFKTELLPHIQKVQMHIKDGNTNLVLDNKAFNLPLLGNTTGKTQ